MRNARYWILLAISSAGWLAGSLSLPPSMCGEDVFIFRDAGWNLASSGSFESAALIYMQDLTPRLYAHYPPIMPLLFAAYASVFPRNAHAGTVFNLLLGLLAASVALACVLRLPPGRLRNLTALAVAILPVTFITDDRPEALGVALFCAAVASAAKPKLHPALIGLLIALVFLAYPIGAVASVVWIFALLLARNWDLPQRWKRTLTPIAVACTTAAAALVPVVLLYYALDHDSLARFAAHSLGIRTGLGRVMAGPSNGGFLYMLHFAVTTLGFPRPWNYVLSVCSVFLLAGWAVFRRNSLTHREWLPIGAALACMIIFVALFPAQSHYVVFLAFLVPVGLLIVDGNDRRLAAPALALLLWAMAINSAVVGLGFLMASEQGPSYRAAADQPRYLSSQLPSPDAIVAVENGSYDLFKPEFHHLIRVDDIEDADHFASVAAVANCYNGFTGTADAIRPLPEQLKATDFHMIQPSPQHLWISFFGHRVMRSQWGYGCDLYLRNQIGPNSAATHR
jgi:hypothetical protein